MVAVKIMFIILMCVPILVLSVQLLSRLIDECLKNQQDNRQKQQAGTYQKNIERRKPRR